MLLWHVDSFDSLRPFLLCNFRHHIQFSLQIIEANWSRPIKEFATLRSTSVHGRYSWHIPILVCQNGLDEIKIVDFNLTLFQDQFLSFLTAILNINASVFLIFVDLLNRLNHQLTGRFGISIFADNLETIYLLQ